MFPAVPQWWESRLVFLKRGTVYRAIRGRESKDFDCMSQCEAYVKIQNGHVLVQRQAAPFVQLPLV